MMNAVTLAEKRWIPDTLIRIGIRTRLQRTLEEVSAPSDTLAQSQKQAWIDELKRSPIALVPHKANEQHYDLPPEFFELVLGKHLKYSSGLWPKQGMSLNDAEAAMLQLSCERAELENGQDVLELGCGWGSLSLWMAEKYPESRILAVSNSRDQRKYITHNAQAMGLSNLEVVTEDMNDFQADRQFDRVVSVEMFEHMRNYEALLERITIWLKPRGKLFVHIFTHDTLAYPYVERGPGDWMARFFFSGGQMPSHDLLPQFATQHLEHTQSWKVNGNHYGKTCREWLIRCDREKDGILKVFRQVYGEREAKMWYQRWRLFFMACEELFNFRGGDEWYVSHYLFTRTID